MTTGYGNEARNDEVTEGGASSRRLLALLVAVCMGGPAVTLAQSAPRHFDIHAQPLSTALSDFARQCDRQILFSTDIVTGKRVTDVKGELEPEAALRLMLQGTGLTFRVMANDTILVQDARQSSAEPPADGRYLRLASASQGTGAMDSAGSQSSASDQTDSASSQAATQDEGEIVVKAFRARTATKTDALLTETPQSISIITADEIANRGAIGLQEALRYTAGVRTEINGSDLRFDYFSARGFSATDYLDGMVRPDNYNTARTDVYTLERVEVLRGPSSVLYGQGTAGGIVNSMTKRPRNEFAAEVGVEYGSYNRKQGQLDVTGPLNSQGTLSGRLVAVYRDADNQFDFGKDDRVVVAPSLRFQPGEATDITLLALYQSDKAASVFAYLPVQATLEAAPGRRLPDDRFLGEPSFNIFDRRQNGASLLVQHRFSDAITFDGGIRYSHANGYDAGIYGEIWNGVENPFIDPDQSVLPRYRYDWKVRTSVLTTDNRVQWRLATGALEHSILTGVDYSHIDYDTASAYAPGAAPLNIYNPVYGNGVIEAELSPFSKQLAKQMGFYVQDQIRVGERATLTAGARRDRVTTELEGEDTQKDRATTVRFGVTYRVTDQVTPYVSYAESFIPTVGLDFYGNRFKPQRGIQYEAGVKWQPDRNTLLTLAGFNLKGTNKPETDPENGNNTIQRGEVTSKGFEIEAVRRLPENYSLSLSYNHIDMKVSKSSDPLEEGFPVSGVPKNQFSAWGEKTLTIAEGLGARVGLGVRRMGKSEEAAILEDGVARLTSPGFTLVDALLAFDWNRSTLSLNATNLLDERYYGSCSVRTACSVGYRRNVVARWTMRF